VVADAQSLPFPPDRFDAIVCQLGLMFFPNPGRGLAEIRRTLRRGRRGAVCVISSPDKAPMWGVLADTLSRLLPDEAPVLHLSFSLSDPSRLERLFLAAGFREVRVTEETRVGTVGTFDEYWAPIEAGIGVLPQAYLALPVSSRLEVRSEVRDRLSRFECDGRYEMTLNLLIGSGAN
jgi:SAM-dependent methyltransferase